MATNKFGNKMYEISTKKMRVLRILSVLTDLIIIYSFVLILHFAANKGLITSMLLSSIISMTYFGVFSLFFESRTVGVYITRLKVVYRSKKWWSRFIRVFGITINFLPFVNILFLLVNFIYILIRPSLSLHDIFGASVVVYKYSNFAREIGE